MGEDALYKYALETFPLETIVADASGYSDKLEAVHIGVVLRARNAQQHLKHGTREAWAVVTRGVRRAKTDGVDENLRALTKSWYDLRAIVDEVSRGSQDGSDLKPLLLKTMRELAARYVPGVERRANEVAYSNTYGVKLGPSVRDHARSRLREICAEAVEYIDASKPFNKQFEESRVEKLVTRTILNHTPAQYNQPSAVRDAARTNQAMRYPPRETHIGLLLAHVWTKYEVERLVNESSKNDDFDYKLWQIVKNINEPPVRAHAEAVLKTICEEAVEYIDALRTYREPAEKKRVQTLVNRTILGCAPNEYKQTRTMRDHARAEPRMRYPPREAHRTILYNYVWKTYNIDGLLKRSTSNAEFDRNLRDAVREIDTKLADTCAARSSSRDSGCVLL